jgi:hypothetical protein
LSSSADDQGGDGGCRRTSWQRVPAEDGVRRDDGVEAVEHAPGQQPALPRETPPLVIGEPQPAAVQLLAEDPILFDEIVDHGLLAAVDPSGEEQRAGTATAQQTSVPILLSEDARSDLRHSANLTTSEFFSKAPRHLPELDL